VGNKSSFKGCNMSDQIGYSRKVTIAILNDHDMRIEDFKDFINMVGIKDYYSTKELKNFLGY
jgi:hypothetical protein